MKKLIYLFLALIIFACSDDSGGNEQSFCSIYLDSNGVTIKACEDAEVGDTGVINGITYTIVDEAMLRVMVAGIPEDLTKVVTTFVTDISLLFDDTLNVYNQNISSWDVSNVTNMAYLFAFTDFNQPIGVWDVSNVTDMRSMFHNTPFNQDISSWDVGNVTNMQQMFELATSFNQNLSSWDVDNVTDCNNFRADTSQWTLPKPNFTNCNPN